MLLDLVVQAHQFLYSRGGENQHTANQAIDCSSVSRHAGDCATEIKEKHFHVIYPISIKSGFCPFREKVLLYIACV